MTLINKTTLKGKCPKCGSENTYIEKRGYRIWLGALGFLGMFILGTILASSSLDYFFSFEIVLFLSPFGFLFGFIGKNKFDGKCLDCGHKWMV